MGVGDPAPVESYVLSLLAEGKHSAAFEIIPDFGSPEVYAPHFVNLARRIWRSARAAEAAEVLSEALKLDPEFASAWLTLGMVKLSQNDLAEGDHCLQEAISLDGGTASAHYLRGVVAKNTGREQDAVEHLVRCLELNAEHHQGGEELRALLPRVTCESSLRARAEVALSHAERSSDPRSCRATLSVCLIVKNEEQSLPRCLASLQGIADQMIVMDTGSTDATAEVARQFGAEVHKFEWCDDFAAARNAAIERAACEWVLVVDADEELPAESADQLRELLAGPIPGSVCQLITHAPANHSGLSGTGLVGHPRLFRNGEGIHFEGAVHEQLVDGEGRGFDEAVLTGIPVLHHGYLEPNAAAGDRGERNLRLLARRAREEPDNPAVLFYLGMAQLGYRQAEEGVAALQRALDLAEEDSAYRVRAAVLLAHGLELLQRREQAEDVLRSTLAAHPQHPELLCALGHRSEEQGRVEDAIEAYRAATRGRFGPMIDYQDFTCRDVKPRSRLAAIHLTRGEPQAAAREAREALAIRPEATEARHLLASALLSMGQHREARAELDLILAGNPDDAQAHNSLGVSLALEDKHGDAAREFEMALALKPGEVDTICNLALSRQDQGDLERARDTWEEALKQQPRHVPAWLGLARTYLAGGAYEAAAKCYEAAALHSGCAPEVMAEIADARAALADLGRRRQEGETPA
ncbi:MAG: tetratricopeptide repeat protein [Armatimonadota bacterium]|nr:MAG: tetratricopeptide repeat protein [Armatimonadota bacterium]